MASESYRRFIAALTALRSYSVSNLTALRSYSVSGLTALRSYSVSGLTALRSYSVSGLTALRSYSVSGLTALRSYSVSGLTVLAVIALCAISCSISYKFNGANINYQTTHSISVADFPNNAPLVNPTLSNNLTEAIRDLYQRQTRLQLLRKGGDLELEGSIVGYDLTQGAISVDSYASESKLTIRVKVHFTNNIYPEESFDKTYSAYQTFDASRMLSDVQDELCEIIIKEIAENIYNDTVAKW